MPQVGVRLRAAISKKKKLYGVRLPKKKTRNGPKCENDNNNAFAKEFKTFLLKNHSNSTFQPMKMCSEWAQLKVI